MKTVRFLAMAALGLAMIAPTSAFSATPPGAGNAPSVAAPKATKKVVATPAKKVVKKKTATPMANPAAPTPVPPAPKQKTGLDRGLDAVGGPLERMFKGLGCALSGGAESRAACGATKT